MKTPSTMEEAKKMWNDFSDTLVKKVTEVCTKYYPKSEDEKKHKKPKKTKE